MFSSLLLFTHLVLVINASILSKDVVEKRQTNYAGQETQLTFFGYPDNCDDTGCYGTQTAYTCSNPDGSTRNGAQGDGSYNDPLSVAFQPGKFGILDGLCASCDTNHLDIWVESSCSDDANNVCACEDQLTPDDDQYIYYGITSDDPSVFNVYTDPLYDESTQSCTGQTYPEKKRRDDTVYSAPASKYKADFARNPVGALGSGMSVNAKRDAGLIPRELLRNKRQTGACAENSCECPSC